MRTTLITFLGVLTLSGCLLPSSGKKASWEGSWQLADVKPKNESDADFAVVAGLKSAVKDGLLLNFYRDGSFSELDGIGGFKTGSWKPKKGHTIEVTGLESATSTTLLDLQEGKAEGQPGSLRMEKGGLVFLFQNVGPALKKDSEDPFYPSNNGWRKRSAVPETPAERQSRLAAYLKHLALLLKASKERKQEVVSFAFSKGPVRIYNGGIGILPYEQVPQEWKSTFSSDSSAQATYILFRDYLRSSSYQGAATGDWVDDDYNILLSIYADLTKGK